MDIKLKNAKKIYTLKDKTIKALDDINLNLDIEKRTVLIGPSGCGKSTLLRILSSLSLLTSGSIEKNSIKTSLVFQNPRLIPWLNLRENVAFAMKDGKDYEIIDYWIKTMGLWDFRSFYPSKLSGGMKARVALARAFSYPHNFLLMDEPFASLDEITKEKLEINLLSYMNKKKSGFLFVTHDLEEALRLGQRVLIMKDGKMLSDFNLANNSIENLKLTFKKIVLGG